MRWLLALSLAMVGCRSEPTCDAAELASRLEGAPPGTVVEIGACEIAGRFAVPPGVTLEGTDPASAITADSVGPTLRTTGSSELPTTVRGLTIGSNSHAAIWIEDAGNVVLEDVSLFVPAGVGVAAERVDSLSLTRVQVAGRLTQADIPSVPAEPPARDFATYGLAIFAAGVVRLEDVEISGFALFGALFVESAVRWERGSVHDSLGTGVMASGGNAELIDVSVERMWTPTMGLVPSYALVAARGVSLATTRFLASNNDGFGILHDAAGAVHTGLSLHDNGDVGVWAQNTVGLTISDSELMSNEVAGVVLLGSSSVTIEDTTIEDTIISATAEGFGLIEAGDGIQIVGGQDITLSRLTLSGSDRVQLLVDITGTRAPEVVLDAITVDGTGTELGFEVQNGAVPVDWDSGVTRLGDTLLNDETHTTLLDTFEVQSPDVLPPEPAGGSVRGIVMPVD